MYIALQETNTCMFTLHTRDGCRISDNGGLFLTGVLFLTKIKCYMRYITMGRIIRTLEVWYVD